MPTSMPSNRAPAEHGFKPSRRSAQHGFTPLWRSAQHGFTLSRRYAQQGFTLIEMLVVLSILGLVAVVAAQNVGRRPAGLVREEGEAKLDLALDTAHREAARTGVAQSVDPAALIPGASLSGALPAAAPRRDHHLSRRIVQRRTRLGGRRAGRPRRLAYRGGARCIVRLPQSNCRVPPNTASRLRGVPPNRASRLRGLTPNRASRLWKYWWPWWSPP